MYDLQQVIEFVVHKHRNGKRKGGLGGIQLPYVIHPLEAVKTAYGMSPSAFAGEMIYVLGGLAGHDLFEETDATRDEVKQIFGSHALTMIENLTFDNRYPDKEAYIDSFQIKPIDAVFGKIIDRVINTRDFLIDNPKYAGKYFHKADIVFDTWYRRQDAALATFGRELVTNVNAAISDLARTALLLGRK